ncbi:MAG: hypothetical protein IJT75_08805 [Bacteroidaceae bacterium]|nr:hypothetical protein [Bacteroidaceae bacterium]
MTATAQKVASTPMAPYIGLMRGMSREDKQIVVTFLVEEMEEPQVRRQVPASFKKLRGMVNITDEEMAQDAHLAHIMQR